MSRRVVGLITALLSVACGERPIGDDDVGGDESTSGTTTDASSTDEDASFDTDESTSEAPDCGGFWLVPGFAEPPEVMLVVDASSSMALETWDHDDDPLTPEVTRWSSARALVEALVAEFDADLTLGLQRFPAAAACPDATLESLDCSDADACPIADSPEVVLGSEQGPAIVTALPEASADALEIVGGSPASAAFLAARDHLLAQPRPSTQAIVLITDGGANCGEGLSLPESFEIYDQDLAAHVAAARRSDQIDTFVIGVDVDMTIDEASEDSPVIDTFAALNAVALAGGRPWQGGNEPQKYYDVQDEAALFQAMAPFDEGITDCVVDLLYVPDGPPAPSQSPLLTIEMAGMPVPRITDCEGEDGWAWIVEGEILSFCGSWCELFVEGAEVVGDYGCPTET